jgi:Toprim domain
MRYRGREVDVLALWGKFVDLPPNIGDPLPTYLPKVRCPNPAHDTTKHHFQINTRKPWVHCFAKCGISGSYERAIAIIEGLTDKKGQPDERAGARVVLRHSRAALVREVSPDARRGVRKIQPSEASEAVERDRRALEGGQFTWLPSTARAYLADRGIDSSSRGKWQIGWDEDEERLVIPALDHRGHFSFLIRHRIDGNDYMKYLYTDGAIKTSLLFGACYIDREQLDSSGLVLCEGPLDVIRLHQLGVANAVAILGTGLSAKQVRIVDKFSPKRVYLFFDKDVSGVANIESAAKGERIAGTSAWKHRGIRKCPLYVCLFPKHRGDPAEMTREEVERSLKRALPIAQFYRKARGVKLTRKVTAVG